MRPRTLLILLALVVGLGLFIGLYERKLPSSTERAEREKKVLPVEKDEIQAVVLHSEKGDVRLERVSSPLKKDTKKKDAGAIPAPSTDEWRLVRPLAAPADAFAVDRLLDAITGLEKSRTIDTVDAKAVGLDRPRGTVTLETKEGKRVLQLGAEVPTGGSLIAGLQGEKGAYVVPDSILADVTKDAGEWRDKQLFHGTKDDVERVTLRNGSAPPVVLTKRATGFTIDPPVNDQADRDAVETLLTDLTGLSAERFVDDRGAADLGLAPPAAAVEVALKGGKTLRVELGMPVNPPAPTLTPTSDGEPPPPPNADLRYARVSGAQVEVRTKLQDSATRAPEAWRSRALSALEVHQIDSATIQDDKGKIELTRAGTDWKRGGVAISYLPVSDLLFALSNSRAQKLLTPAEAGAMQAGAAKPALTVKLRGKEAGEETMILYPPQAQGVPARVSGRGVILLLQADALKQIQDKLADVRAAKPVPPEKK
jgi:hypothetical protein